MERDFHEFDALADGDHEEEDVVGHRRGHGGDRRRQGRAEDVDNDDEDPFEAAMEAELDRRARKAETDGGLRLAEGGRRQQGGRAAANDQHGGADGQPERDVLSDSDSEEEVAYTSNVADDHLLYDPDADEEDERHVQQKRLKNHGGSHSLKAANSDAVLNCPGCFAHLCFDCQRHELYENQFRAMFVENVTVLANERLRFPLSKSARRRRGGNRGQHEGQSSVQGATVAEDDEVYHPVRCVHCSTEVAMYDKDQVYHFFNVIPSH
jgi:hypothetical protein